MWAVIFWVVSLLTTVSISDKQPELQKPVLTQVPKLDEVYTEEKVTLTCDIGEGWQYHWFKNNVKIQENASTDRYFTGKQYIFSERTDSLVVEYTCQGYRVEDNSSFSQKSDAVIIRVIDLPKPTLTHWPEWSPVYIGESVTLRCHSTWKYLWFKDDKCLSASGGQQDYNYTVTEDSDQAEYKCQGYNEERNLFSHYSTSFTLKVNELPKPVISHYPEWTDLYSGENMTIMCEFEEGWQYQWIKNGKPINTHEGDQNKTGSLYIITDPTQPKEQKYQCQGYNEKRKVFTKKSELVTLKISDLPKPTLKRQPAYRTLYEGDSVSLKCEVKGVSKYLWLKDGKLLSSEERVNTNGDTYNIKAATQSDNGVYGCQGFIEDRNVHTPVSKPLTLSLSELFTDPVLTIIPATSVFDGDPVILQCQSTSTKWETQLNYSFLKDEGTLHHDSKQNRIQIFKTSETDIGKYTCEVDVTGTNIKKTSNSVQLTVKGSNPKPVLTLIPPWEYIFTMETVSLVCQVDSKRDDWKYQWFKDGDDTPLPCNDNCNITRVTVSDEGRYWCRGKRGDPPVYSQTSNFVSLNISELPEVKLNLEPPHTQIFVGYSFTLRCASEEGHSAWKYMRLRGQKAESLSSCLRETEQCTIKNAAQTDSGVYWCESGQKRSNSITLFVSGGHTVLQAPPQPVIEGDALILKCRYWWSGYKATFYKDNALFSSLTNEEPTINNVSKRNEGTYKCQINGYNSPELMVSVRRLFSRLSLKASPALKVQVGQILNLTCEALVNKKERVKLMYTFMKDNVTVTNSDSAVHSIMTANRSHTGAYRCIVRSVTGVTKESESIIIVVEGSSMMIIMVAVFCSVFFILLVILIVTFYHISKKKGLLCFQDKTRISTDQHHAYPECIDLPGQTQEGPPTSTKDDAIYTEISPSPEDQGVDDADPVDEVLYSDLDLKTLKKNKKDWNTLGMKNEVIYSEVNSKFSKTSTLKMKTGDSIQQDIVYCEVATMEEQM